MEKSGPWYRPERSLSSMEEREGAPYLTEETLDQYMRYVTRWKKAGRPLPVEWLATLTRSRNLPVDPCHVF